MARITDRTMPFEQTRETLLSSAYQRYMKELRASALHKVNDPATCDDLVQDTFMKTWMYLRKGGKIAMMRPFLYHVLNNLIIDEYRKHKALSLDALVENGHEPGDDPSERLYDFLDGKVASISIQYLPEKYQKVMNMRYGQGLSLKEMSFALGQSKNTIAVHAHRGLERLRLLNGLSV